MLIGESADHPKMNRLYYGDDLAAVRTEESGPYCQDQFSVAISYGSAGLI